MSRTARRAAASPRLEVLDARALLSGSTAAGPVDPASAVFVRFKAGTPARNDEAALNAVHGRVVSAYPDGPALVALPSAGSRAAALRALRANPAVVYAEADGAFRATGVPSAPLAVNDPVAPSVWGMRMIDAPLAWAITTGAPSTIVAVLDTGIDLNNPEFAGHLWTNPTADTDGYRGDTHGWNFVNATGNVQDNNGHGSHVSGVLGAQGNNGTGIAGVDWGARIMPLKVLDAQGNGSDDSAISGIYFAVAHGARVINASWGGDAFSQAMLDALNYANRKGVVFVTAAGNDSVNNDTAADPRNATTYPGSYRTPNELVVAAVNQSGDLADFSNYGATTVDLAAPGVGVLSTVPTSIDRSGFATYDGTSMATPFVSGTVALLAGLNPGLTAGQLVARVRATVKPLPQLDGLLISPGVVDPLNALLNRTPLHPAPAGPPARRVTATGLGVPPSVTPFSTIESTILSTDSVYTAFGGTASGYAAGLVQAIDGRAPTPGELSYLTATLLHGEPRAVLIGKLQNSTEGRLTRVARWFVDELGATAPLSALKSDPGVVIYAGMLARGASVAAVQGLMFGNVVASVGPAVGTPPWAVTFLFRGLLHRVPDPAAVSLFSSQLSAGTPVAQIARQLLGSAEGRLATIAYLYRDELGSTASIPALQADAGVAYWSSLLGAD